MKIIYMLAIICGVLFCPALPAAAQSKSTPGTASHRFVSPDHTVTMQYSDPLLLCQQDTAACQNSLPLCTVDQDTITSIACLAYGGSAYSGYNYTGAALAIGIVNGAKDETACFDLSGTKTGDEKIDGVLFKTSHDEDAGAGHFVNDFIYRGFYGGRCYAADLRIATTNFGSYDPGAVKEFKSADEQKVRRKLKQALDSLRLTSADSSGTGK